MQIITKYFPALSAEQTLQMAQLEELYTYWNCRINVISRKDIGFLYERHVLHSLAIAKVFFFTQKQAILDVGTGGGFPGIPLAILYPQTRFHLVDSIGKKILVVKEIAGALKLSNVTAGHTRVEDVKEKYDFIMSRALTDFPGFVQLVKKNLLSIKKTEKQDGLIYLKGGDFSGELKGFEKRLVIYNISDFFAEEFFETKKIIHMPAQAG